MDEKKLYAMMAVLEDQQQAAAGAVKALEGAVEAISESGKGVTTALVSGARTAASEAAAGASKAVDDALRGRIDPLLASINATGTVAEQAARRLEGVAQALSLRVIMSTACIAMSIVAASVAAGWMLTPDDLPALRAERAALIAQVQELEARGGRINLGRCDVRGRVVPCVEVPREALRYERDGRAYVVPVGY